MKEYYKILSMNKIKYIEKWFDCDYEEQYTENIKYIFNAICNGEKYEIEVKQTNGSCGSGYCNATFGNININKIKEFSGYTHKLRLPYTIQIDKENLYDYKCDLFEVYTDGGDEYYPSGYVKVYEGFFEINKRYIEKPTIYIFKGKSGIGKTFLANSIINKTVYETDSNENLPKEINSEIIVLGNKYNYKVEDITSRITIDCRIVVCNFYEKYRGAKNER